MSYQTLLNQYLDKYGLDATIKRADDSISAAIKIHLSKFTPEQLIGDITDAKRRGIVTVRDLDAYGEPESGDKILYLSTNVTVDFADPRIETGQIIGYDLILRGDW